MSRTVRGPRGFLSAVPKIFLIPLLTGTLCLTGAWVGTVWAADAKIQINNASGNPGDSVTVNVSMDTQGAGARSFLGVVTYDDGLLKNATIVKGAGTPSGWVFSSNVVGGGELRFFSSDFSGDGGPLSGVVAELTFTIDSNEGGILTFSRMFAPAIGIAEDPVTGNGNGPLGAYLIRYKMVDFDDNRFEFKGKQGVAMGRPGVVHVSVDVEGSEPTRVRVGGQAVILFKTEIVI